jgi:hypothetical protein
MCKNFQLVVPLYKAKRFAIFRREKMVICGYASLSNKETTSTYQSLSFTINPNIEILMHLVAR